MNSTSSSAPSAPRLREDALNWFVRRRDIGLDAVEEQAFQAWLQAESSHQQAFAHWQAQWQTFDAIPPEVRALLQRNLAFDQAMAAASGGASPAGTPWTSPDDAAAAERRPRTSAPQPNRRRFMIPALATAAVTLVAGWSGWQAWRHEQAQPLYTQTFATRSGQLLDAALPDQTRLRLDTATRLEVAYYRDRREVRLLDGQALFEVHANPAQPFDVLAGPLRVTVVGTRFSVRHTPGMAGADGVTVAVEEGRVRVAPLALTNEPATASGSVVLLSAGEQVASDANGLLAAVSQVPAAGVAPWRSHRLPFDNQRLDRVLAELARYGPVPLVIHDPAVAALPVTGVFDPRDLATFQRVLPLSLPVRLQAAADGRNELVFRR